MPGFRGSMGSVCSRVVVLLAVASFFPDRLAAQALAKLDLPLVVMLASRSYSRSEQSRNSCGSFLEFGSIAKCLVTNGDNRDSEEKQRIPSCGIRRDAV